MMVSFLNSTTKDQYLERKDIEIKKDELKFDINTGTR
jgi:hypothetical protein